MKPPKSLFAIPSLAAALLLRAEIVERVVVKVNGDIVTLSEFQSRQVAAAQAARLTPDKVEAFLRENNARILQDAVDDLLLVQRAADLGLRMRAESIQEILDNIKKENNLASDQDLVEQLRKEGMTLDDLKRSVERSVLKRQVLSRDLEPKTNVTEDDLRAAYAQRQAEFSKPETVQLQGILVSGDDADQRAAQVVARARSGEDFAALAAEYSSDSHRAAGGDMGRFVRGELAPQLEAVAFKLDTGAISDAIAVSEGYRILRLVAKDPGGAVPFDEAKAGLKDELAKQKWSTEYDHYIQGLRKAAVIDIRVREVPLSVTVPVTPSIVLEPPDAPSEAEASRQPASQAAAPQTAAPDSEIVTSGQAGPERVAPGGGPRPTPTPPPR